MNNLIPFISNHWQLWVALIIILLLIFINELISQKKRGKTLTTAAAITMINHENAPVFDLREADLFRSGHIVDAIRVSADDFEKSKMDKYKTQPFILVCARGIQSTTLAAKLKTKGFTQPMVLTGGMAAWQAASLPLIKGK